MEDCPAAHRGAAAAAAVAASLPEELILEILSHLPASSINRFKCVSKRWRDLIVDPLHQKQLPQTLQGFFCSDGVRSYGRFISLPGRSAPLIDASFSFLTQQPEMENIKLLDSCNGLVLFEQRSNLASTPSYAVCNPATEEWVAVPSSGDTSDAHSRIYLVFDPAASPHFHLVRICPLFGLFQVRAYAYSSETRGRSGWSDRVRDGLVNVGWGTGRSGRIAFANGMMYFIMEFKGTYRIVAMGREGKPSIIPLPYRNFPIILFVAHSRGRLHCVSRHFGNACPMTESGLSIWVLEDCDAGHWVLKHSVCFSELHVNIYNLNNFSVVSIHPDCDRVLFFQDRDLKGDRQWKLLSYDMHSKEVHAVRNFGHAYWSLTPYVSYFIESSVLANKH